MNSEKNIKEQKLIQFFKSIPEFLILPQLYQDRIIKFFLDERHYMVDPTDIKLFLDGGKRFDVYLTFEEFSESVRVNPIKRVLGCKRYFESSNQLFEWLDRLHSIESKDGMTMVLTHSMGFEFDEPEEWYIASI